MTKAVDTKANEAIIGSALFFVFFFKYCFMCVFKADSFCQTLTSASDQDRVKLCGDQK